VITSPDRLFKAAFREVILKTPQVFKIAALNDIAALFPPGSNPFYAGFGNRDTDVAAYKAVGVNPARIFIVNPAGEVRSKGGAHFATSYPSICDIVDDVFPSVLPLPPEAPSVGAKYGKPISRASAFEDTVYWKPLRQTIALTQQDITEAATATAALLPKGGR